MSTIKRVYLCTRGEQTWTVPTGVTSAIMECWGATGGADYQNQAALRPYPLYWSAGFAVSYAASANVWNGAINGGSGPVGYVKGTLAVTPGTVYYLYVGGNGANATGTNVVTTLLAQGAGGFNGGGAGGQGACGLGNTWGYSGSGGGGATDVRTGGNALANRILVAGGAGGSGGGWGSRVFYTTTPTASFPLTYFSNSTTAPYSSPASPYFSGGAGMAGWGGGATGGSGERAQKADGTSLVGAAATGGTQSAGGTAGTTTEPGGTPVAATAGALGVGGAGGYHTSSLGTFYGGGGGGGGYYGGGGGSEGIGSVGVANGCGAGGGGGSNFVGGSYTNVTNAAHLWPVDPTPGAAYLTGTPPNQIGAVNPGTPYPWLSYLPVIYPGGYIRLTYTVPPSAPVLLVAANQVVPVDQPFDVSWIWSSLASADSPQTDGGADVVYNFGGDTLTYAPPSLIAPAEGKTAHLIFPANTFTAGRTYTLKVRIYDGNGDVSPYTSTINFRTIAAQSPPVVTTPTANSELDPTSFTVTWTNPNGAGTELTYRVLVTGLETGLSLDTGVLRSGTRLNLDTDPTMKASTGSWNTLGGTLATDVKADPWAVANCYKMTRTSSAVPSFLFTTVNTIPGVTYTWSAYFASAAATDPTVSAYVVNTASPFNQPLAVGNAVPVAGTPGNWQRVSVTFTAVSGQTSVGFTQIGGSTNVSYYSSGMVEIGSQLGLYFGTATSKDPGVSGVISTTTDGLQTVAGTDVLSSGALVWPDGSERANVKVYLSTLTSREFMVSTSVDFKLDKSPPGVPTVVMTTNNATGSISLQITAVDTPNKTARVDVYRSVVGVANSEIRIARLYPPVSRVVTYVDYTPGCDVVYQYRVRAVSLAGGFEDVT